MPYRVLTLLAARVRACADGTTAAPHNGKYTGPANSCSWTCDGPRFKSFDGRTCGLLMELLLPSEAGGIALAIIPLVVALALLAAIVARASSRLRLEKVNSSQNLVNVAADESAVFGAQPLLPDSGAHPNANSNMGRLLEFEHRSSVPGLSTMPKLESLHHALMWEKHKYRAKQHVARLYLTGHNSMMHPWQLPPLPPELRRLLSEGAYYQFSVRWPVSTPRPLHVTVGNGG